MEDTTYTGYMYGIVIDKNTGKIIENAKVTPIDRDRGLKIEMPLEGAKEGSGIYFAAGKPGMYTIEVAAETHKTSNVDILITSASQRRNLYLELDVQQSSPVQKA